MSIIEREPSLTDSSVNADIMVARVKQLNSAEMSVILIEGGEDSLDRLFWRSNFTNFNIDDWELVSSGSKNEILQVVVLLDEVDNKGALAVVDADFDHLLERTYSQRLILTDVHDLEGVLFHSSAREKVWTMLINEATQQSFEQSRSQTLVATVEGFALFFGRLRYLQHILRIERGFSFQFDEVCKLRNNQYWDKRLFVLKPDVIKQHFCGAAVLELSELEKRLNQVANISSEQLIHGHDLFKLLADGINACCRSARVKELSEEVLGNYFCMAFSKEDLCSTLMFQTLKQKAQDWNLNLLPDCS